MSTRPVPQLASVPRVTLEAILEGISVYFIEGGVHEGRVLYRDKKVLSGFFDCVEAMAKAVFAHARNSTDANYYISQNAVTQALLARGQNRFLPAKNVSASDWDVVWRTSLVLDVDPKRPSGISATDEERRQAEECAKAVVKTLRSNFGWPEPDWIDSGNGYHLVYKIDLPNDDEDESEQLIKSALRAADSLFSTPAAHIDTTLFNASRIIKIPGTVARKGDSIPSRPHRLARIIIRPEEPPFVSVEQLAALAEFAPKPEPRTISISNRQNLNGVGFDLEGFFHKHNIEYNGPTPHDGGEKFALVACPFNPEHTEPDAAVFRMAGGVLGFKCFHNSCSDKQWKDFREYFDGPRELRQNTNPTWQNRNGSRSTIASQAAETTDGDSDASLLSLAPYPKPIGEAGYHGSLGDFVRRVSDHTEADPNFLLVSAIVAAGNILGRNAHVVTGADRQYMNLFACGVGATGDGRKGSAAGPVELLMRKVDPTYCEFNIESGTMSSGEGFVYRVRDAAYRPNEKNKGELVQVDPGITDKRILWRQGEFGGVMQNMKRQGNTLSSQLRLSWDGVNLASVTKNSPCRATNPHISIIANITQNELIKGLETEGDNGFANRFMYCCSTRSKELPEGGNMFGLDLDPVASRFLNAIRHAGQMGAVERDEEAKDLWGRNDSTVKGLYHELTKRRSGMFAATTGRAAPIVLRMALVYAMLDTSKEIKAKHLLAAKEVWRYCEESAQFIFGDSVGDPVADQILAKLRKAGPDGMTRTQISELFQKNRTADEISRALRQLHGESLSRFEYEKSASKGRPKEVWFATGGFNS